MSEEWAYSDEELRRYFNDPSSPRRSGKSTNNDGRKETGRRNEEERARKEELLQRKRRLRLATFGIVTLLCFVAVSLYNFYDLQGFLTDYFPGEKNINPPVFEDIESLKLESERIQEVLGDVESLSIGQLQIEIGRAAEIITKMQEEVINQETYIERLQNTVEQEYARAREARANADTLSLLTETELRIVEDLLSANAKEEAKKGFWLGILFSIPIGLFTSIVASWLFEKWF